jgi:hypothetical protein
LASITTHFFCTSAGLAEKVFMCGFRENGNRRPSGAELERFLEKRRAGVNAF